MTNGFAGGPCSTDVDDCRKVRGHKMKSNGKAKKETKMEARDITQV